MNEDRVELIKTWASDWASGDVSHLLSIFTDDCVYEDVAFGTVHRGSAELKDFAEGILSAFPDFHATLDNCFATENFGTAEWKMSGTHRGDLPGMPATNKSFTVRGTSVFEFASGRIRRCSDYWDQTSMLKQLKLIEGE